MCKVCEQRTHWRSNESTSLQKLAYEVTEFGKLLAAAQGEAKQNSLQESQKETQKPAIQATFNDSQHCQ